MSHDSPPSPTLPTADAADSRTSPVSPPLGEPASDSRRSQISPLPSSVSSRYMYARPDTRIHFVGIGGIGMSGIAEILLSLGYRVSGSDLKESETTRRLRSLGGLVAIGHRAENLTLFAGGTAEVLADAPPEAATVAGEGEVTPDVVVISSAVHSDNPEVFAAQALRIPVIRRAEMLAELMRLKFSLAVAGSHGKTTTSSLLTTVLKRAGLDPTAIIGGKLAELGSNARLGQSDFLVAEADESDGSFLQLLPAVGVITNIDPEHIDHYGSLTALEEAFVTFANQVPFYGRAVLCIDHPVVAGLLPRIHKRYVTYGLSPNADYRGSDIRTVGLNTTFTAWHGARMLGSVTVRMPGVHSAVNALAVLAVCDFLGVPFSVYQAALADFAGVGRRFTVRGEVQARGSDDAPPIMVVDDYGHHPAEIRATLAAARAGYPGRRVLVAFQPHRYTRTRDLLSEFALAFTDAALVCVADIYAASEAPIPGVTSAHLVERITQSGHPDARYVPSRHDLPELLCTTVRPGDIIITLGAGDISHSADDILSALRKMHSAE